MKTKTAKFIREARLRENPPVPQAPARLSGLYLLALRTRAAQSNSLLPRRKLVISIDSKETGHDRAQPVRINHA